MFLSMLKKNSFLLLILSTSLLTSCVSERMCEKEIESPCHEMHCHEMQCIEIPCQWFTPLDTAMTDDDPDFFLYWEALRDPLLNNLIEEAACRNSDVKLALLESREKGLETMNQTAADIAKNYIELRGLQSRLNILEKRMHAQNSVLLQSAGLSTSGFTSSIEEGKNSQILSTFFAEKSQLTLSINKIIFHLSSLLNYLPCDLFESLSISQAIPSLPTYMPVGSPIEILSRNQALKDAKRDYQITKNSSALFTYEKKFYSLLEEIESALATFYFENEAYKSLKDSYLVAEENYQLTLDLYNQGLKDDLGFQAIYLEFLSNEDALVQAKVKLLQTYITLYQTFGGSFTLCNR